MSQSTVEIAMSLKLDLNDPNSAELCQSIYDAQPVAVQLNLIDYDGFIQRARDLIAYGQRFNLPELTQLGEKDLAFWLERKASAERLAYFDGPMDDGSRSDKWLWTES